jgi:hypothetical protein
MRHGPCTAWWRPCKPAAWSPTPSQRARPSSWVCVGWLLAPLTGRESERERYCILSELWIRIRSGSRGFDDQKLKKKRKLNFFLYLFFIKNCNLLMAKLKEKPSTLKRKHPTLQEMKFINFFLCLWVFFCPPSGSGSRDPIESGSNPDPHSTTLITLWVILIGKLAVGPFN